MMSDIHPLLKIRPVRDSEEGVVREIMQRGLTDEERRTRFDKGTIGSVSQLVAVSAASQERILGAIYWHEEANHTAQVWMPRCAAGLEPELGPDAIEAVSLALLDAVDEKVALAGLDLAQVALGDYRLEQDGVLLERSGYRHLADLLYMATTPEMMPSKMPDSSLEFEPYEETEYERLRKLVEVTYQGTLDCPGLDGVQSIDTVLEGYRSLGRFLPQNWRFVRYQDQDVGCLLLADHPEQELFELVYMGLTPDSRGKGWGYEIARFAQWLTRAANRTYLVVAVDATNTPAVRAYEHAGYFSWDRRRIFFKRRGQRTVDSGQWTEG